MKYQKIKNYKYKLAEPVIMETGIKNNGYSHYFFSLDQEGCLVIHTGYLWDGVSGPTIDTQNTMLAGLVHDALYQAIRLGRLHHDFKDDVDKLFYKLLITSGVSKIRAGYYYKAVQLFGHSSCKVGDVHIPEVLIA